MGSKYGKQIWEANMGSKYGKQIWEANMGSKYGKQIWEALLGTMLQGVAPDNSLLNQSDKAAVLSHQSWMTDHSRFDDTQFSQRQGLPLAPDGSREIHVAPHGQGNMRKRLHNEIHHLASEPIERAYTFRTLVSVWLGRSEGTVHNLSTHCAEGRLVSARRARDATPLLVDVFRSPHAPFAGLRDGLESYLITLYSRFCAATVAQEGIVCEHRVVD
ncbi:hypothetical protein CLCR_03126 [Cladophialophora carrionii]|uniref:Uncharacterized protein n=1 Tax=Cladophialophora carrionii TaxID=86049 RepID=A0A1C1D2V6_9EURO|nr:hypothetical protein CLCR_03126 [Cladophialophora carrionii]